MTTRNLRFRRAGVVIAALLSTTAASAFVFAPASAAAPTGAALTWTGDDAPGRDACMNYPCQGAAPGHPWSFSATSGGLSTNDVVSFTFSSTTTDRLHAVAMPRTIDPNSIDVVLTGVQTACYNVVDSSPTHPSSVSVDWANQKFSFPMPGGVTAGQTAQFCFTDTSALGMPLTPSGDTTPYRLSYTEPGGSVSATYRVLSRRTTPPLGGEAAPPYMHLFDSTTTEVSNAGEAGTAKGFFNTLYKIVLKGTANTKYQLQAASGRLETGLTKNVVDPRVTVTCLAACTADASGNLAGTFTVSPGADEHFVIVADCDPDSLAVETRCVRDDIGVISFTATAVPAPVPSPTPSVPPALPKAGRGSDGWGGWPALLIAGIFLLGGLGTFRRVATAARPGR